MLSNQTRNTLRKASSIRGVAKSLRTILDGGKALGGARIPWQHLGSKIDYVGSMANRLKSTPVGKYIGRGNAAKDLNKLKHIAGGTAKEVGKLGKTALNRQAVVRSLGGATYGAAAGALLAGEGNRGKGMLLGATGGAAMGHGLHKLLRGKKGMASIADHMSDRQIYNKIQRELPPKYRNWGPTGSSLRGLLKGFTRKARGGLVQAAGASAATGAGLYGLRRSGKNAK